MMKAFNNLTYKIFTAVALILIILLISTPFAVSKDMMNGSVTAKFYYFIGISVILCFTLSIYIITTQRLLFNVIDLFIIIWVLYVLIRGAFTSYTPFLNQKILTTIFGAIIYISVKGLLTGEYKDLVRYILLVGFLFSGFLQAIIGIFQYLDMYESYSHYFYITGTFNNPTPFAIYLSAILAISLNTFLSSNSNSLLNKGIKYFSLITTAIICMVLIATMIRASWVASITIILISLQYRFHYLKYAKQLLNTLLKRVLAISMLVLLLITMSYFLYNVKRNSASGRLFIWKISGDIIKEQPIFGIGLNRFSAEYNNYQSRWFSNHPKDKAGINGLNAGIVGYAYNEFIEIAVETGIIGLCIFIILIFLVFKSFKMNGNLIYYLSLLSIIITACFSYPFSSIPILILFYIFISIVSSDFSIVVVNVKLHNYLKYVSIILLIIIPAYIWLYHFQRFQAERDRKMAYSFYQSNNIINAKELYEYYYKLFSDNGFYLMEYGKVLALSNEVYKSNEILEKAITLSSDVFLYTNLGDNYQKLNNYKKAENMYQFAGNMVPNMIYPKYLLAKLYFKTGKINEFELLVNEIIEFPVKIKSQATDEMIGEIKTLKQ